MHWLCERVEGMLILCGSIVIEPEMKEQSLCAKCVFLKAADDSWKSGKKKKTVKVDVNVITAVTFDVSSFQKCEPFRPRRLHREGYWPSSNQHRRTTQNMAASPKGRDFLQKAPFLYIPQINRWVVSWNSECLVTNVLVQLGKYIHTEFKRRFSRCHRCSQEEANRAKFSQYIYLFIFYFIWSKDQCSGLWMIQHNQNLWSYQHIFMPLFLHFVL